MKKPKVALTWWGSWPHSQITVGDMMSVAAIADSLRERDIQFHIIHREREWIPTYNIPGFSEYEVYYEDIDTDDYDACLFICGPLPTDWPEGRQRLFSFSKARRLAVGVTLSKPTSYDCAKGVFHDFLARDGLAQQWMDLSLSAPWIKHDRQRKQDSIAVCFRGFDSYHGIDDGNHVIDTIVDLVLRRRGIIPLNFSTVIDEGTQDISELDTQFALPGAIITTRLHGSLLSIRHSTPYIAIDQIIGDSKVKQVNKLVGWPMNFSCTHFSIDILDQAIDKIFNNEMKLKIEEVRDHAIEMSQQTKSAAIDWIERSLNI